MRSISLRIWSRSGISAPLAGFSALEQKENVESSRYGLMLSFQEAPTLKRFCDAWQSRPIPQRLQHSAASERRARHYDPILPTKLFAIRARLLTGYQISPFRTPVTPPPAISKGPPL